MKNLNLSKHEDLLGLSKEGGWGKQTVTAKI
jgi:hypothetical protein